MYKYGNKRTWEHAVDAVEALGGRASVKQVRQYLLSKFTDYKVSNTAVDLDACSVNCPSRGTAYPSGNRRPRRTDTGHQCDRLYKHNGDRQDVTYELYTPLRHGVYELYENGGKYLATRQVADAVEHPTLVSDGNVS